MISHPDLSHPWPDNLDEIFPARQQLPRGFLLPVGDPCGTLQLRAKRQDAFLFLYASLIFSLLVTATLRLKAVLRLVAEWRSGVTIRMVT